MAQKKYGLTTQLHIQPGSELDYEQDGLIRGVLIYEGGGEHAGSLPLIGQAHPNEANAFAYSSKITVLPLLKIRATVSYIGLTRDPTDYIIEGIGSMSREPIETHPRFVSTIGGTMDSPLNDAIFNEDGSFAAFPPDAAFNLGGVESYLNPTIVIRRSYWTRRVPDMKDMGQIVSIPGDVRLPGTVEDMMTGATTYRNVGAPGFAIYQVTEELLASGPNGINTKIYPLE